MTNREARDRLELYLQVVWQNKECRGEDPYGFFHERCFFDSPNGEGHGIAYKKMMDQRWHQSFHGAYMHHYEVMEADSTFVIYWKVGGIFTGTQRDIEPQVPVFLSGVSYVELEGAQAILFEDCFNLHEVFIQIDPIKEHTDEGHRRIHEAFQAIERAVGITAVGARSLSFYIHGWTAKEVAMHLGLSPRTVEVHVQSGMKKCGANSRIAIIDALHDQGLAEAFRLIFDFEIAAPNCPTCQKTGR